MSEDIFRSGSRPEAQEHFLTFERSRIVERKAASTRRPGDEATANEGLEIHPVGAACIDGDGSLLGQKIVGGDGGIGELEVLDMADRIGSLRSRSPLVCDRDAAVTVLDDGIIRAPTGEDGEIIAVAAVNDVSAAATSDRVVIHGGGEGVGVLGTDDILHVAVQHCIS